MCKMSLIEVKQLSKSFGAIRALEDVSFTCEEGDIMGYIGPNGSGKTTTIRTLTGLCKPSSGSVKILNVNALTEYRKVGRMISVLFETQGLSRMLTVRQNLEFYARLTDLPRSIRRKKIDTTLEMVGLTDRQDSLITKLSKGMLRKLALGRLLITEPRILIMDEPFDGIDVASRVTIMEMLRSWVRQTGRCILISSHSMQEIEELCNRICILKDGRLINEGTIESLLLRTEGDQIEVRLRESHKEAFVRKVLDEWEEQMAFGLAGNNLLLPIAGDKIGLVAGFLHQRGIKIEGISVKRESLVDAYLRMVGDNE